MSVHILHGRRKTDAARVRRISRDGRQSQRQQVAALLLGQRVYLVHDDGLEIGKEGRAVLLRHEKGELFQASSANMSGGAARWRARFDCGVSPVRVSIRKGRPISSTGTIRLRATSCESAFSGDM